MLDFAAAARCEDRSACAARVWPPCRCAAEARQHLLLWGVPLILLIILFRSTGSGLGGILIVECRPAAHLHRRLGQDELSTR